jgi:DNA-binding MarR family transcriptional regulator
LRVLRPSYITGIVVLGEQLEAGNSVFYKHIKLLEDAGYVVITKKASERRQRTWLLLSPKGRKAFSGHVEALKEVVG